MEAYTYRGEAEIRSEALRLQYLDKYHFHIEVVPLDKNSPMPYSVTFNCVTFEWKATLVAGQPQESKDIQPFTLSSDLHLWCWEPIYGTTRMDAIRKCKVKAATMFEREVG